MTAAKKLEPSVDPVLAALSRLSAKQRVELDQALADIDAGRTPSTTDGDVALLVAARLDQEALVEGGDDLTPEELAELEQAVAASKAHPERLIPLEVFLAERGM